MCVWGKETGRDLSEVKEEKRENEQDCDVIRDLPCTLAYPMQFDAHC